MNKTPYQAVLDEATAASKFEPMTVTLNSSLVESSIDEDGNIKLTLHFTKLDFCPDMLHNSVHEWCQRNKVDSEILCEGMLKAAVQEAALSSLRQTMLFKS